MEWNKTECTNKCNNHARSSNHPCRGKAVRITSVYVSVVLVMQHAMRVRSIILSSMACLAVPYFCTFSHKTTRSSEKRSVTQNAYLNFFLQIWPVTFLILRRIWRDITINVRRSSCKVPVILVRFWLSLKFLESFELCTDINFHENQSNGSRVVPCRRTNRRTDMMKLIVTFYNFSKGPKICFNLWNTVLNLKKKSDLELWRSFMLDGWNTLRIIIWPAKTYFSNYYG